MARKNKQRKPVSEHKARSGRPSSYKPEFCDLLVEFGRRGMCVTEIVCELDISKDTFYSWIKKHKEFSDAFKRAKALEEKWWINLGKNIVAGKIKGSNPTMYIWMTKNLIHWRDKVEHIQEDIDEIEFYED